MFVDAARAALEAEGEPKPTSWSNPATGSGGTFTEVKRPPPRTDPPASACASRSTRGTQREVRDLDRVQGRLRPLARRLGVVTPGARPTRRRGSQPCRNSSCPRRPNVSGWTLSFAVSFRRFEPPSSSNAGTCLPSMSVKPYSRARSATRCTTPVLRSTSGSAPGPPPPGPASAATRCARAPAVPASELRRSCARSARARCASSPARRPSDVTPCGRSSCAMPKANGSSLLLPGRERLPRRYRSRSQNVVVTMSPRPGSP